MKYLYFLLALLLRPAISFAQNNYKPGYIVTFKGDTVKGFINYKEWNNNPKSIDFKKNAADANFETYNTKTITAFTLDGTDIYNRYIGKISQDLTALASLSHGVDSTYKVDTVFLRQYVQGRYITLHQYIDGIKTRYFISENTGKPYELLNHIYLGDDNTEVHEYNYRQQLHKLRLAYQSNNSKLIDDIQRVPYTINELAKLIQKLNGETVTANVYRNRGGIRFFAGAAINANTITLKLYENFSNSTSNAVISPVLSVGFDYLLNKNVGKVIFRGELSYYSNKANLFFSNVGQVSAPVINIFDFNQSTISLTPQVICNFYNKPNLKVYGAIGLSINTASYKKTRSVRSYPPPYYITPVDLNVALPGLQSFFVNPLAKIGVTVQKHIDIHFAYIPPTQISNHSLSTLSFTAYQGGVSYLLNKK